MAVVEVTTSSDDHLTTRQHESLATTNSVDSSTSFDNDCDSTYLSHSSSNSGPSSIVPSCTMDANGCVSLDSILRAFNEPLNEEQAWALCHQTAKYLAKHRNKQSHQLGKLSDILIRKDGRVVVPVIQPGSPKRKSSEKKLISSLGVILFRALDHGCDENEERQLQPALNTLIERLTSADECGRDSCDEGIERDSCEDGKAESENSLDGTGGLSHGGSDGGNSNLTLDNVIEMCSEHSAAPDQADSHYRAVCRALVAEALELSTFLSQISTGTNVKLELEQQNPLNDLRVTDWARIWMQLMRELRNGVKLKKVDYESPHQYMCMHPIEFELTPFEMLLDDIRSQRYKLNTVIVDYRMSPRVRKDAHALILDFIRSRPPLVPVSKRKLRPAPPKEKTLYERLMQSIKEQHQLKPTPQPLARHGSIHLGRIRENCADLDLDTTRNSNSSTGLRTYGLRRYGSMPLRRNQSICKRLIRADINLRLDSESDSEDTLTSTSPDSEEGGDINYNSVGKKNKDRAQQWRGDSLTLTLQEVQHIRSAITKAEIEYIGKTKELRADLENGRVCFTCLKTRFNIFTWGVKCKLCEKQICDKCATRMDIPRNLLERFDKIPISMLIPSRDPARKENRSASLPGMDEKDGEGNERREGDDSGNEAKMKRSEKPTLKNNSKAKLGIMDKIKKSSLFKDFDNVKLLLCTDCQTFVVTSIHASR